MDQEPTGPSIPERVHSLWFEDGNIVLQAGNSYFRVFRGILAARSPVFRDMLSFPQPADAELVDGCPVVRLPDSSWEVTVFLRAIFEPEFLMPYPAQTDFDAIAGCLRLSHKYGVDYLRRRALIHLSSGFPTTLAECDVSIQSWDQPDDDSHLVFIIRLAYEVDALWILPHACYELGRVFKLVGTEFLGGTVYNGVSISLDPHLQQRFLHGYHVQITSCTATFLYHPLDIIGCTQPEKCITVRMRVLSPFERLRRPRMFAAPLHSWEQEHWAALKGVCSTCLPVLKQTHKKAREEFWDRLPQLYGLPSWEELEERKSEAIGDAHV